MEIAIIKAHESGYKNWRHSDSMILLDPLFWQALSKAEGWKGKYQHTYLDFFNTETPYEYPEWLEKWHRFIDHLAKGEDVDSFFEELLK